MGTEPDLLLPAGSRLLHIGPHKTGTTAVQSAFHLGRRSAGAHGIRYAGPGRTPTAAAQAAVFDPSGRSKPWAGLLREVRAARYQRIVISSEWFSDAEEPAIARIIRDLGPGQTHVVVTLRPLARILPSQWQQFAQGDFTTDYPTFLGGLFGDADTPDTARFWHRHRHGRLVERWARFAGPDNVTVVVADHQDHGAILRAFEALCGLAAGALTPEDARRNRSLTWPEIEVVRAINRRLIDASLGGRLKQGLVLFGAAAAVRNRHPAADEPAIHTPAWVIARASEIAREEAALIEASGVRVVGDLASLSRGAAAAVDGGEAPSTVPDLVWAQVVGSAATGVLRATGLTRTGAVDRAALDVIPTSRLIGVVAGRLRDRRRSGAVPAAAPSRVSEAPTSALVDEALTAFVGALQEAGFAERVQRRLQDDVTAELVASAPATWPDAAAALAVGIARAAGYIAGGVSRRKRPRRSAVEIPEVVDVSTGRLGLLVARRVIQGATGRAIGGQR